MTGYSDLTQAAVSFLGRVACRRMLLVGLVLAMLAGFGFEVGKAEEPVLSDDQVATFAGLVLAGIDREYPNKPSNVLEGPQDVRSPQALFPAFYGCFDWHSSVHGHWVLVKLLKSAPTHPEASRMREALERHLTAENLRGEFEFFSTAGNRSFERMYGWAWFLRLAAELHTWDDEQGQRWREALRPLELLLIERSLDYLPKLSFPIRSGVHPNTAFAMSELLDYARIVDRPDLAVMVARRARDYYFGDENYPDQFEPSGEDFFSPGLCEADLMRRVLPTDEFVTWLNRFLPDLENAESSPMLIPVEVPDVTDGKLVHLAGLDLSRAWCLRGIVSALPENDPHRQRLATLAQAHLEKGLTYVTSGHYEGEHWLATFAVYAITDTGIRREP